VKKLLIACIIIISIFFGCSTFDATPTTTIPLEKVFIADVKELIDKESYLEAIQYLARLKRESREVPAQEIETLQQSALDGIKAEFYRDIENQDFSGALSYFLSLQNISAGTLITDWSEADLRLKQAETTLKKGNEQLALLQYLHILDHPALRAQDFNSMLQLAQNGGNHYALRKIITAMNVRKYTVPAKYREELKKVTPISTMVEGTVTIWVNRGVRLEKGVGRPDIIIGSGFFIDPRGYILTNYHVISSEVDPEYEGYSRCYILLSDNQDQKIPVKVVSYDKLFDLALLKAEITPSYVFSTIDDEDMSPGQKITVIGSPVGLENTVTAGIISTTGRRILQLGDAIQIDAPVNFGNSGGPVIGEDGRLVGLVFAGLEEFEGLNFALPAKWINKALTGLFSGDQVFHLWTGIALKETPGGLEVIYVMPGSPAFEAGIRVGDILRKINGIEYKKIVNIQSLFLNYEQPALVTLTLTRNENVLEIPVCLQKRPFIPLESAMDRDLKVNLLLPLYGMKLEKIGTYLWDTHYQVQRVLEGSVAEEIGLSEYDSVYIRGWEFDPKNKVVLLKILAQRRKKGFLEGIVYLPAILKTNFFI
jgi:serine protease Do